METPELVDIGANLANRSFHSDLPEVIERAFVAGVTQMLVTGTTAEVSAAAVEICKSSPGHLFATAGLHPHHASDWNDACERQLRTLLQDPAVVAVGETGLDFNRNYSTPEAQVRAFQAQLSLAAELRMPVFIHDRDSAGQMAALLRSRRQDLTGAVVHCFTGSEEELESYLALDLYIGITGWICDERRGGELQSLAHRIPPERVLLETDAPYLLPRDLRPKPRNGRNEPAFLAHILAAVARCMNIEPIELAAHSRQNARNLFNLPDTGAGNRR